MELLYAAGDEGEIELACEGLKVGWQDEQALFIHRSQLNELPPVLRAFVGCATALFGDVAQADLIKLHKVSGKVTFMVYDDFDGKPLPELRQRIKVNLRTRWVRVFDYSADGQLLYFKERFVSEAHPGRGEMDVFATKLRRIGFAPESIGVGPLKPDFLALLASKGLNERLNKRRLDMSDQTTSEVWGSKTKNRSVLQGRSIRHRSIQLREGSFAYGPACVSVVAGKEPRGVWIVLRLPFCVRCDQSLEALVIGDVGVDGVLPFAAPNVNELSVLSRGSEFVAPPFQHL